MEEEGWKPRLEADFPDAWDISNNLVGIGIFLEENIDIKQMKKHNTCSKWQINE